MPNAIEHRAPVDGPDVKGNPYYFTLVTLQVDGTQYRVPRHYLEQESKYLANIFRTAQAISTLQDSFDDAKAVVFSDVRKADLEQLLRVIFPARARCDEVLSVSQWTSVLEVSASWQMTRMIEIAIDEISKLDPSANEWETILHASEKHKSVLQNARALAIQQLSIAFSHSQAGINKVRLARQYKVKAWLRSGLRDVVESSEISEKEQNELGCETTCKLYRIRERYRSRGFQSSKSKKGNHAVRGSYSIQEDIEMSFKEELKETAG